MFEKVMARLRGENENKLTDPELRLAIAALLVAAERADVSETELENSTIVDALVYLYRIGREEAGQLAAYGAKIEEACVDIKDVTDLITSHLSTDERARVFSEVWEVLVADYVVGVREESFSRRLASLLALTDEQGENVRQAVITKSKLG